MNDALYMRCNFWKMFDWKLCLFVCLLGAWEHFQRRLFFWIIIKTAMIEKVECFIQITTDFVFGGGEFSDASRFRFFILSRCINACLIWRRNIHTKKREREIWTLMNNKNYVPSNAFISHSFVVYTQSKFHNRSEQYQGTFRRCYRWECRFIHLMFI